MSPRPRGARALVVAAAFAAALSSLVVADAACSGGTAVPRTEGVDVTQAPPDVRAEYDVFARRCSKCHSLARPLNSGIDDDAYWELYVERMRRQPGSGISHDDARVILRFLHYSSTLDLLGRVDGMYRVGNVAVGNRPRRLAPRSSRRSASCARPTAARRPPARAPETPTAARRPTAAPSRGAHRTRRPTWRPATAARPRGAARRASVATTIRGASRSTRTSTPAATTQGPPARRRAGTRSPPAARRLRRVSPASARPAKTSARCPSGTARRAHRLPRAPAALNLQPEPPWPKTSTASSA